jgi:hypothetical protein
MDHSLTKDTELDLLETILKAENSSSRLTQRDLAQESGLSLGMTNLLVRRLATKGLVMLTKLSSRKFRYALTATGMNEIAKRTAGYFKRATRNAELYRSILEEHILEKKLNGVSTVVLMGSSDVDFLLEYICERHDLVFVKSADPARAAPLARKHGFAVLVAGDRLDGIGTPGVEYLGDLLVNKEYRSFLSESDDRSQE